MDRNTHCFQTRLARVAVLLWLYLTAVMPVDAFPIEMFHLARQNLYQAQVLIEHQKYEQAANVLRRYLDKYPPAPEQIFILLGNCYMEIGNRKSALNLLRRGVKEYPDSFHLHYNLGIAAHEQEQFIMAGDSFARAYEIQQKNRKKIGDAPQLLYYSAAAYFQGERYPQALKIIERLLNRADLSGQVEQQDWIRLKNHNLCQLSRWRTATETLLDLLDRQPQLADYWKLLAQVELHRNRYSQAAAALETSYLLAPPEKSGWLQLADIYLYLNAPLPAARCLQKTIDEYGPRKIVRLYEKTNRYDLAISQCNQLIARHPCADNYLL